MERIKADQHDVQDDHFYMHELKESSLMKGSNYSYDAWRPAHGRTLEWQGIEQRRGYEKHL